MPHSFRPDPTTPPGGREADAPRWLPIDQAPRESGVEIIGTVWSNGSPRKCLREPFVSFWSPSLQRFYCGPTHFILMPRPPADE